MGAALRVGVVGLGKVAQLHHLPGLAALPGFRLVGVCDVAGDLAKVLAEEYGLPAGAAITDHRDLLGRGLDAVLVTNRHHAPVVSDALAAGVPVFVEKPVCWGLEEGRALVRLAEETGVPVQVGYMKRYDPAVERLCQDGPPADVVFARVHNFAGGRHRHERLYPVRKPDDPGAGDERDAIGDIVAAHFPTGAPARVAAVRTLAELAIHDVNLLRGLFGELSVAAASAWQTPAGTSYLATLRHGETACALEILADFASPRDWDEQLTVYTKAGCLELAFASPFLRNAPTLLRRRGAEGTDAVSSEVMVSRESPYLRQLRHFQEVASGRTAPRTPLHDAVRDLELVYELARTLVMT